MEFSYEIKIPKDRVAVLIGVKGNVKKKIEKSLKLKINVDSREGDVIFTGDDSLALVTAQNIAKAIGRGFNPEVALELLDENNCLEIIDISDYAGESRTALIRIKARVIGTSGKARKNIERLTDTNVVVYGKTIAIIGGYEGVRLARMAFEDLLKGSRHSGVYSWLEKHRKDMKVRLH